MASINSLFNSPIEAGLRVVMLLVEAYPRSLDVQRLVILDYLMLHSGDLDDGPPSLHPPNPLRSGEVSIRREMIEDGIHLMATKGLVSQNIDGGGINYKAEDMSAIFINAMTSPYSKLLYNRAQWAIEHVGFLSDADASKLLEKTIGRWKTEFVIEELDEAYE